MENQNYQTALHDLSLIKKVILTTRHSLTSISKIFIYWGLLAIVYNVFNWFQTQDIDKTINFYDDHQWLMFIPPLILLCLAMAIYKLVTRKTIMIGLEKHLLLLWVLIIFLCSIPTRVNILTSDIQLAQVNVEVNNISSVIFALGIALIMTAVLTDLRLLAYLGTFYTVIAFGHAYFNLSVVQSLVTILQYTIIPFTFILTGIYLRKKHEENDLNEYQLNS